MEISDQDRQSQLLPGVSRTFALTIPQLPEPLCTVVTNAYLLCRIADTIEDDVRLSVDQKAVFHQQFRKVLDSQLSVDLFAQNLLTQLADTTSTAERKLIENIPIVIRCLRTFTSEQQKSLQKCINKMSQGMPEFQRTASLMGLDNMKSLDRYCYYVAGVVGEMLTELFCDYSPQIKSHRNELIPLSISFGQGLQMTNILKDLWDDRRRQVCWLPRDVFQDNGLDLAMWSPGDCQQAFNQSLRYLVVVAKDHLENALKYVSLIPAHEVGIRRFSLWAIGLAVLTLRNIYQNPAFSDPVQVKVSRRTVKSTILVSNLSCRYNVVLNSLFKRLVKNIV